MMATLRNIQMQLIINMIRKSRDFTLDDFILDFPDQGDKLASIHYRGLSKYYFYIEENILYGNGIFAVS